MKRFLLLFLIFISVSILIFPQGKKVKYHPFSGTVVLSFEGGTTLESTDYEGLGFDYFGKASLEYFLDAVSKSSFGFRLQGGAGFISGTDNSKVETEFRTRLAFLGIGAVYLLSAGETVFPYLSVGASTTWFDPIGADGNKLPNNEAGAYDTQELGFNGELGVRFLATDNMTVNLFAGINISPNDNLDDIAKGTSNDMFFTAGAGVSFSFFAETDSDEDGVIDSKDMCPDTKPGIKVDENGCPRDSDDDGVADFVDECPETPKGVNVDAQGCPKDNDRDGVPDYKDICPNTPAGIEVDDFGCAFDLDADGIPDYKDKCPDTPFDAAVDKNGCPVDSDLDGVPDHIDQCPDTKRGTQVDKTGCEVVADPEPEKMEVTLSSSTSFAFNSANLKPEAFPELDKLLALMKKYPTSRWRIEGHTDNVGSPAGNLQMSQMRAQSVLSYFVTRGVSSTRFEVEGLGDKYPVADNATEEGRAKNRRVTIKRIDK